MSIIRSDLYDRYMKGADLIQLDEPIIKEWPKWPSWEEQQKQQKIREVTDRLQGKPSPPPFDNFTKKLIKKFYEETCIPLSHISTTPTSNGETRALPLYSRERP